MQDDWLTEHGKYLCDNARIITVTGEWMWQYKLGMWLCDSAENAMGDSTK